ncbi:hypothetical protein BH11MYX2_BH11MYX2_20560 [soil metagenome]
MYIPATSVPPTTDPMFDLLRRARPGGSRIVLGTQSPADFDYEARDYIGTWLVGKINEQRAIDKMRNLLGLSPHVSARLASQSAGQFSKASRRATNESV